MIKAIALVARKEGTSKEAFLHHWETVHADMAKSLPLVRKYTLNFIVAEPTRPDVVVAGSFGEIDGIAEIWYDDMASYERHRASAEAKAWHADGALIIGRIKTFIVEEKPIIA